MHKFVFPLISILLFSGCATTSSTQTTIDEVPAVEQAVADKTIPVAEAQIQEQVEEVLEEQNIIPTGIVFAKVDLRGVVEKSYATFSIRNLDDPQYVFELTLGDREQNDGFPWVLQQTENGYFFIELPQGRYQITSVSIPVSSTLAVEPINIYFDVSLQQASYLGYLTIDGTKEKIHWGGIPVVKPGFEYTTMLAHKELEAYTLFHRM